MQKNYRVGVAVFSTPPGTWFLDAPLVRLLVSRVWTRERLAVLPRTHPTPYRSEMVNKTGNGRDRDAVSRHVTRTFSVCTRARSSARSALRRRSCTVIFFDRNPTLPATINASGAISQDYYAQRSQSASRELYLMVAGESARLATHLAVLALTLAPSIRVLRWPGSHQSGR